MTDKVNPSPNRTAESYKTAGVIAHAGSTENYIQPADDPTPMAFFDEVQHATFQAFDIDYTADSLEVDIFPGEAFIFGSWLARDDGTAVPLSANANQTIFLGWDHDSPDQVLIGTSGSFSTPDQRMPLWDVETDGSGVTSVTDQRKIGKAINIGNGTRVRVEGDNIVAERDGQQIILGTFN